jgi:MFS family permease
VARLSRPWASAASEIQPAPGRLSFAPVTAPFGRQLRSYLGLLRHRDFRRLWLAQSVSALGTEVTFLALPLVAILVLNASAFEVAVLGATQFVAFAIFGLPAGVWVDRASRKRILVTADLGRAAILLLVPIAAVTGLLAMWQLYAIAFAASVLTVFFEIAYQAILPELVERDRLAEGNSRLEVSRSAAQVLGPGLGGLLVGLFGAATAIVADALSFIGSASFLIGLRTGGKRAPVAGAAPRAGLRHEIAEGLRFYRRSPLLLSASAAVVTLNFGFHLAGSILLVFLVRDVQMTPQAIGLALSIGSIGTLAGSAGAAAFGRRFGIGPTLIVGCGVGSAAWFLMIVATAQSAFVLLTATVAVQGLVLPLVFVNGVSLRQTITPDALLGRVNATARWLHWTAIPIGTVAGGLLGTTIGLRATVAIGATIALFSVVWLLISPLRSVRDMPTVAGPGLLAGDPLAEPSMPLGQPPA